MRKIILPVALVAFARAGAAQTFVLDLAKQAAGSSLTLPAPVSGDVSFRVVNRRPDTDYTYAVVDTIAEIGAFAVPAGAKFAGAAQDCATLADKAKKLGQLTKESEIGQQVSEIDDALKNGACKDPGVVRDIEADVAKTTFDVPEHYTVSPGHILTLTVWRTEGTSKLTWTLTVQGLSRGTWLTVYGAAFVQDRDENYFSQAAAQQGKFNIVKETNRSQLKPIPAVFFSWLPRSRQDKDWAFGPTAGLGVKDDHPAAFLGGILTYNWNIGLQILANGLRPGRGRTGAC